MLVRIPRASCALKLLGRRYATNSKASPKTPKSTTTTISTIRTPSSFWGQTFTKVTAYPFQVKPRDAQVIAETVEFIDNNEFLFTIYCLLPSALRPYTHYLCRPYVKYKTRNNPLRVKAVYVPMWKVFALLDFMAVLKEDKRLSAKKLTIADGYLPGTPLSEYASRAFFSLPKIEELETKPVIDCIKPFGMDAQCLPFTVSPFSPFDLAKKYSKTPIQLDGTNILVLLDSIKPEFYAVFPVMVPVYTIDLRSRNDDEEATVVLQAFGMQAQLITAVDDPDKDHEDSEIKIIWQRTAKIHAKKLATMPPLRTDEDACIRPLKAEEIEAVLRLVQVKKSFSEWNKLDTEGLPEQRKKAYLKELIARDDRVQEYIPSWWRQSKLAPEHLKREASTSQPKDKSARPSKSRSSPI
ncbi:hypothetical protein BDN70DRAFT_880623 [Pholiota conissans]|uniref:Uncharacterized protein n=1 Tax=Pholiota conissans TaxID=109636 RepID=A0A9P6CYY2_9AGAR|nr:hypothetical protein BDN70DRAFT_880623 [Pholiota conissans]